MTNYHLSTLSFYHTVILRNHQHNILTLGGEVCTSIQYVLYNLHCTHKVLFGAVLCLILLFDVSKFDEHIEKEIDLIQPLNKMYKWTLSCSLTCSSDATYEGTLISSVNKK
jgi:hypothetical protein